MVKNPPARAGNVDSIPDLGRPHVQQSSHAREPHLLSCALEPGSCDYGSPYTSNPRSATRDATAVRSRCAKLESRLQAALLGKKPTQQRQPSTAKKINKMGFILGIKVYQLPFIIISFLYVCLLDSNTRKTKPGPPSSFSSYLLFDMREASN